MKLFWHLVAADLRRLRVPLAVWVVVVAANTAVEGAGALAGADAQLREAMAVVASLLWLAELLLMFVVVSLVIHAHPTVGTDAFWLTRPIPPRTLLASKLLVLATALVIVPAIADMVLLATHQVPRGVATGVFAQRASMQIFIAVLLTMAAALTLTFARFALLCGAAVLSVAVAIGVLVAIETARMSEGMFEVSRGAPDRTTSQFVSGTVLVVAGLALLLVQYTTRARWRSAAVGVTGAVLSYVSGAWWSVPFLAPVVQPPAWAAEKVTIAVDSGTIAASPGQMFLPGGRRVTVVTGVVTVNGLEPGWTVDAFIRDASVRLADGATLRGVRGPDARLMLLGPGAYLGEGTAARDLLGVKRVGQWMPPQGDQSPFARSGLFAVERDEIAQHSTARGDFHATAILNLTHHEIEGVLPIRPGAAHRHGGHGLVLGRRWYLNNELVIDAREWRAESVFERQVPPRHSYYVRNAARSEALAFSNYDRRGSFTLARFLPLQGISVDSMRDGFYAAAIVLTLPPRFVDGAQTLSADEDWLRDAEVVIVRTTPAGSVTRTLDIPDFPVLPKQQVVTER